MKKLTGFIKLKSKILIAIMLSLVAGGALTGIATAAIPDSNGQIHSCYRANGGQLRIIDSTT